MVKEVEKRMSNLIKFKMNKNRINRKKSGIHSPALMLLTVLMVLGFIFMIIIFARMAVINREEIRKEAEAGNELIRIYISIDEEEVVSTATTTLTTISGTQTQTITTTTPILNKYERTRITITNQWGKTSVIDYFVVEAWNGKIISKGEFNPPLILGAGEERIFKGNDILTTFKLNNSNYANDFWFFKDHIRCITLHTKLGNTFGSAYKPVKPITQTYYYYYETRSFLFINYTTTITETVSNQTAELDIRTKILFNTWVKSANQWIRWTYTAPDTYSASNFVWRNSSPLPDGLKYRVWQNIFYELSKPNMYDARFLIPIGTRVKVSFDGLPIHVNRYEDGGASGQVNWSPYYWNGFDLYVSKWELKEKNPDGSEGRTVLLDTSKASSITFKMNYSYILYREIMLYDLAPNPSGGGGGGGNPPPITTTTTTTGGGPIYVYEDSWVWEPVRDSESELTDETSQTIDDYYHRSDYYVWISSTVVESGGEYIVPNSFRVKYDPASGWGDKVTVDLSLRYQPYTPIGKRVIRVRVSYRVYYIPWIIT